jgi:hypothetical protein
MTAKPQNFGIKKLRIFAGITHHHELLVLAALARHVHKLEN